MPQLHPIPLLLPSKPSQQLMRSLESYTAEEIKMLKEKQKEGFIHILKPSPSLKDKKQRIREKWEEALRRKFYLPQQKAEFYYYTIQKEDFKTSGFVGGCDLNDFVKGRITMHEKTYSKRVAHMTHYLKKVRIQAEPVILIYEEQSKLTLDLTAIEKRPPLHAFSLDKSEHRLWVLNAKEGKLLKEWSSVQAYFHLADGHHRVASLRNLAKLDQQSYLLSCFLVPQNQLQLYSFVWYLKGKLNKRLRTLLLDLFAQLKVEIFDIEKKGKETYALIVKLDATFYGLKKHFSDVPSFLYQTLKSKIPGLLARLDYVPDTERDINVKRWETCDLAFFMQPISMELLFNYAKSGKNLPAKSTYILPKLHTGFLVSPLH